jgi:Protein of unknown function (DUF3405)
VPQQVLLFLTHQLDETTIAEYHKISQAVTPDDPTYLLFHSQPDNGPTQPFSGGLNPFTDEDLDALGYPMFRTTIVPGSGHFPLINFARQHPDYDYYWIIEYDVRFSGNWRIFFDHFKNCQADFLTSHIRNFVAEPKWHWWQLEHPEKEIPLQDRFRSFNPIYRMSRQALKHIDLLHQEQWSGHYEVLLPTLLYHGGFNLRDFGGKGPFVKKGDKNRFYLDDNTMDQKGRLKKGTMRFRPCFPKTGWHWKKLYHPVKTQAMKSSRKKAE